MNGPDNAKLVEQLLNKTRVGKLRWTISADEDEFITAVGGEFAVALRRSTRPTDYRLTLRDTDGIVLMEFGCLDDPNTFHQLEELFELARRTAYDVGHKVDQLLGHLNRL